MKLLFVKLFLLLSIGFVPLPAQDVVMDNWNKDSVQNWPDELSMFELKESKFISYIDTYHWNDAKGSTGNQFGAYIKLKEIDSGMVYGPWKAILKSGTRGAKNVHWVVYPNITIPAGIYIVHDSDPATWSNNRASNNIGFTKVISGQLVSDNFPSHSQWDTNFGKVYLNVDAQQVSGHYDYSGGKIVGTFDGTTIKGWWSETDDSQNCGPNNSWSGPFIFKFSHDKNKFEGSYGKCSRGETTFSSLPNRNMWYGSKIK